MGRYILSGYVLGWYVIGSYVMVEYILGRYVLGWCVVAEYVLGWYVIGSYVMVEYFLGRYVLGWCVVPEYVLGRYVLGRTLSISTLCVLRYGSYVFDQYVMCGTFWARTFCLKYIIGGNRDSDLEKDMKTLWFEQIDDFDAQTIAYHSHSFQEL